MNDESNGTPYAIGVEFIEAPDTAAPHQVAPPATPRERLGLLLQNALIQPKIRFKIEGAALEVPADALTPGSPSMSDIVEACYLFGDSPRVHAVSWQLRWIGQALLDKRACAEALADSPPSADVLHQSFGHRDAFKQFPYGTRTVNLPGARPPEWAMALVEYLGDLTEPRLDLAPNGSQRAEVIERAAAVSRAYDAAVRVFSARVGAELEHIEDQARTHALEQLAHARMTILNQGWRLLGLWNGVTFEDWPERETAQFTSPSYSPTQDLKDLTHVVDDLTPLAEAVLEAESAIQKEIWGGMAKAAERAAIHPVAAVRPVSSEGLAILLLELYVAIRSEKVADLRQQLADAQVRLAGRLAWATTRFPVLFRFSPSDLSNLRRWSESMAGTVRGAPQSTEAALALLVRGKLLKALDANARMRSRFEASQPLATARRAGEPTTTLPDQALAQQCVGSIWAYPKIVMETLQSQYIMPGTLAGTAAERLLEAVTLAIADGDRGWQTVMMIEGLVSAPLSVVCPPVGLGLDLACGVADAVMSISAYRQHGDEYYCALDPVQAYAEIEPSALPVVLSICGVALVSLVGV